MNRETAIADLRRDSYSQHMMYAQILAAVACAIFLFRTNTVLCTWTANLGWINPAASFVAFCTSIALMVQRRWPSYNLFFIILALFSTGYFFGAPSFVNSHGTQYIFEPVMVLASTAELTYAMLRLQKEWSVWVVLLAGYLVAGVVGAAYYLFVPANGIPGNGVLFSMFVPAVYLMTTHSGFKNQVKMLEHKLWDDE